MMRFPAISIKQALAAVAIAASLLGLFRTAVWVCNPSAGPLASQLKAGDEVLTAREVTAIAPEGSNPGGEVRLAAGTRCFVVSDPTGDEDDCYGNEGRLITVRVAGGGRQGVIITLARRDLRLIPGRFDFWPNR
jgi:hypothetical protein